MVSSFIIVFLVVSALKIVSSGGPQLISLPSNVFTENRPQKLCLFTVDFVELNVYQGSACFVDHYSTWDDAFKFCKDAGMELQVIANNLQLYTLMQTADKIYGQSSSDFLWVNAKKNTDNYWIAYNGGVEKIMREYYRLLWADKSAQTAGDCLSLTNYAGPFRAAGKDCKALAQFICSYDKTK